MDDCFISDSTYGSLSGMHSSSSSFTMSLSESETFEDQPSTSGCSSEMTHKQKRKERVKQYLRQLKAMVPPSTGRRGKMGTISALQHIIGSLQKIHGDKDKSQIDNRDVLSAQLDNSLFDREMQLSSKARKQQDYLHILLSLTDQKVIEVSENVSQILGYPQIPNVKVTTNFLQHDNSTKKGSWVGRHFTDFIHKKDLVTVTSSVNIDSKEQMITSGSENSFACITEVKVKQHEKSKKICKKFYFRIRNYKGLQGGFNINKADQYTAFEATMTMNLVKEGTKSDSIYSSPSSEENYKGRSCIFLECVPLKSIYKEADLKIEDLTFHMRHTLFCSYSFMHPNAIPLLGYLPQDMNGMSIFDFYHEDDLESLYGIYKQIVTSNGTPFKSRPIRLKTHNGNWVTVETEWSSFANPWSHRLEFIIGQHKVIKYPSDTDVFDELKKHVFIEEMSYNQQKFQQKIRQLLLEPISDEKITAAQPIQLDTSDSMQCSPVLAEKHQTKLNIEKCSDRKKVASPDSLHSTDESLGRCSNQIFSDHETSMAYEQLNYANSIKRFLLSQQKSYSSSSEKKSPSCEEDTDVPCTISTSTADPSDSDFEVDLSIPKPPSFGSSTKVLLSEHEPREDVASSPAHQLEDHNEESVPPPVPAVILPVVAMPPPPPPPVAMPAADKGPDLVSLTQDALHKHTKQQEELFVNQSKQEKNPILPKLKYDDTFLQEQQRKRSHSPDNTKGLWKVKKPSRVENLNLLTPPFPLENVTVNPFSQNSKPKGHGTSIPQSYMDYMLPFEGIHRMGAPKSTASEANKTAHNKTLWPYYPQYGSGASFYPQVMGGFYHGPNMYPSMISQQITSDVLLSNGNSISASLSRRQATQVVNGQQGGVVRIPCQRLPFSETDLSSSLEETSSSFLYLLEPDSQNSSGQEEQVILRARDILQKNLTENRKRPTEQPWLESIHWTQKLAMNYTIPKRKKSRVLKEDQATMSKSVCSDILLQQMLDLQCQIELDKKQPHPVIDEEAEYLFFDDDQDNFDGEMDCKAFSGIDNEMSLFRCESHSHGIENYKDSSDGMSTYKESSDGIESFKDMSDTSNKSLDVKMIEEPSNTAVDDLRVHSEGNEYQEDRNMDSSSLENDSTCSKSSSDLTPSDQRSAGEAGSSLKESDATSSKGSVDEAMKNFSESEKDTTPTVKSEDSYHMFFIIPPIVFADTMDIPPWLSNCDMNPLVEMGYVLKTNEIEKRLEEDSRRLKETVQPDLVKEQMNIIFEEINLSDCTMPTLKWIKKSTTPISDWHQSNPLQCPQLKTAKHEQLKMEDKLFDKLFVSMFNEDCHTSDQENFLDIEDMSSSLQEVD